MYMYVCVYTYIYIYICNIYIYIYIYTHVSPCGKQRGQSRSASRRAVEGLVTATGVVFRCRIPHLYGRVPSNVWS